MAFANAVPVTPRVCHGSRTTTRPPRVRPISRRVRASLESAATSTADAEVAAPTWPDVRALSRVPDAALCAMDINEIMRVLPHRYPFLLLDRVLALEPGVRAIGVKSVSINEPFFPGHFPQRPIMPGVLQVEALAQLCGVVMLQPPISDGTQEFFFGGVDGVRWRRPVVPGDTLVMECVLKSFKKRFGIAKMQGRAFVDGKLVVEGELTLAMVVDK